MEQEIGALVGAFVGVRVGALEASPGAFVAVTEEVAVTPVMPAASMALLISAAEVVWNLVNRSFAAAGDSLVIANWMSSRGSCSLLVLSLVLPICVIAIWLVVISRAEEIPVMMPFCLVLSANRVLSSTPDTSKVAVTIFAAPTGVSFSVGFSVSMGFLSMGFLSMGFLMGFSMGLSMGFSMIAGLLP